MTTLDDLFREYLHRIEPCDDAQDGKDDPDNEPVKRAREAHQQVREALENDEQYGPHVLKTMLSGSYGRCTSVWSIKDVDVIVQTGYTRDELRRLARQNESEQHCLLRLTQEALIRADLDVETKVSRRSIHVTVSDEINALAPDYPELTLDVVPVLAANGRDVDPMTIADRELREWHSTYPRRQSDDSVARNGDSAVIGDRHGYKPQVKLLKAWKRIRFGDMRTPKGFVLECLAYAHHNPTAQHWGEAVRDLFQNICDTLGEPDYLVVVPEVHDVATANNRLIRIAGGRNMDPAQALEQARDLVRQFHNDLDVIKQALEEAKTDLTKSARTWRRLFGKPSDEFTFPLPEDLDAGDTDDGKAAGSAVVSAPAARRIREAQPFG
jgi:hypothetical protein